MRAFKTTSIEMIKFLYTNGEEIATEANPLAVKTGS